jgi:serine-type D-Ala-D-Ala endopeptidase (penicillin-binding protein 7)
VKIGLTLIKFIRPLSVTLILLAALSANATGNKVPLTAQAWLVTDSKGAVIQGSNMTEVRSIASITKLMTAMVVLDSGQSLNETIPKKLYNRKLTRGTLLDLAIVKSDNNAAKMLCDYYPGGMKSCIEAMNTKAKLLSMDNTTFTDPTGRYHTNVSTAEDLIKLVFAASTYPMIIEASNMDAVRWNVSKKKKVEFRNTNRLVGQGYTFLVSKTGFISKAGGCIVMMLDTAHGIRTVVLLGSKNMKTRIPEAEMIALAY